MNKLAKTMITSVSILLLLGLVGFIVFINLNTDDKSEALTLDEMNQNAFETPEMTTDLSDGHFVRIQFQLITDNKKALTELEKREFQIRNIIIKEIAVMKMEDFQTGLSAMEASLQTRLNEVMESGSVVEVFTISKILQ